MKRTLASSSATRSSGFRVVYGETRPAWEQTFPTRREANAFSKRQQRLGDVIFSIKKVTPGEPPQSLMAAIAASSRRART